MAKEKHEGYIQIDITSRQTPPDMLAISQNIISGNSEKQELFKMDISVPNTQVKDLTDSLKGSHAYVEIEQKPVTLERITITSTEKIDSFKDIDSRISDCEWKDGVPLNTNGPKTIPTFETRVHIPKQDAADIIRKIMLNDNVQFTDVEPERSNMTIYTNDLNAVNLIIKGRNADITDHAFVPIEKKDWNRTVSDNKPVVCTKNTYFVPLSLKDAVIKKFENAKIDLPSKGSELVRLTITPQDNSGTINFQAIDPKIQDERSSFNTKIPPYIFIPKENKDAIIAKLKADSRILKIDDEIVNPVVVKEQIKVITMPGCNLRDFDDSVVILESESPTSFTIAVDSDKAAAIKKDMENHCMVRRINGSPSNAVCVTLDLSKVFDFQSIDKRIAIQGENKVGSITVFIPKDRVNTILKQLQNHPECSNIQYANKKHAVQISDTLADKEASLKNILDDLADFQIKTIVLANKISKAKDTEKKNHYLQGAQAVNTLSQMIRNELNKYVYSGETMETIQNNIKAHLEKPEFKSELEALNTHREIKQQVVDIISGILSFGVLAVYKAYTGQSFFKVNTDSQNKWEKLEETLDIKPKSKL